MKKLKYFKQLNDYTSNKDGFEYPTISYVEENTNVYYMEKPGPPIVTYTTTGQSQQVQLVNKQEYFNYCKIVETGEELPVTGTGELNYTFTESGEHQVELKIKDDVTILSGTFDGCTELTTIPENLFSNCTAVTYFEDTFAYCEGLTGSIPENLFKYNTAVTDFTGTFVGCTGLTSIPENLFVNNTKVDKFGYTFDYCTGLTGSIPENLFSNCTAVTSFNGTFGYCSGLTTIPGNLFKYNTAVTSFEETFYQCSGLTNIPENLFANNTAVTGFSYTFSYCSGLTSIPENLFKYNTAVTSFEETFYVCTGLTGIPENLFKYNTAVTSFSSTFSGCTGLTGNVPVDNDGTPIYKRSGEGKPGYAIVTNHNCCFCGCDSLTDYSLIPNGWNCMVEGPSPV